MGSSLIDNDYSRLKSQFTNCLCGGGIKESPGSISIVKILVGAFVLPWWNRKQFISVLALPACGLIVVGVVDHNTIPNISGIWYLLSGLLHSLFFVWFAIATHRSVLLEDASQIGFAGGMTLKRGARFFLWVIAVYIIVAIVGAVIVIPLSSITGNIQTAFIELGALGIWIWVAVRIIFYIPCFYILGRLSPIFPATAIDNNTGLGPIWKMTKGHGWPMFVIVGFLPLVIGIVPRLLLRNNASFIESIIVSIVICVLLTIEITALSLAYKELAEMRDKTESREQVV